MEEGRCRGLLPDRGRPLRAELERLRLPSSSAGISACRSLYRESWRVGWLVRSEYALTLNVKSFGVRSIHSTEFRSDGGK